MKNVANIKAYAANLAVLVFVNNNHKLAEKANNGATILYRVRELTAGEYAVEGFRASMADGDYKTFEGELANGYLWAGSKRLVLDAHTANDRASTELVPLMMHFHDSKFEEFFIAEDRPIVELVVKLEEEVAA